MGNIVKKARKTILFVLVFVMCAVAPVSANYIGDISYSYMDNGGGNYTFEFTVSNLSTNPDTGALDYFEISFDADSDYSLYSNITWGTANGWDTYADDYDPGFGGIPGVVLGDDSIAFGSGGGGISQGMSLGSFYVTFDYAGSLLPENQLFSWYANFGTSLVDNGGIDMGGYFVLGEDFGLTRYDPAPIPEPSTIILLLTGLGGACLMRRRSAKS